MSERQLGIQMWTLRKEIAEDLAGTLKRVAEIGYQGVELLPMDWPDVAVMKGLLDDTGLKMFSAHVPFVRLRDDFDAVADYCRALGAGDLVVPSIPPPLYKVDDDLKRTVDEIADVARKCKAAGFRCSYHNHATEFEKSIDGMEVHDYIFATVPADLLNAQIDTYFVESVGKNPAEYVTRFAGRLPLLHIKEQSKTPDMKNTEIGAGTIDWDPVFAAAENAGVEWYIVEQNCEGLPALESVAVSYEFMKSKGLA